MELCSEKEADCETRCSCAFGMHSKCSVPRSGPGKQHFARKSDKSLAVRDAQAGYPPQSAFSALPALWVCDLACWGLMGVRHVYGYTQV